MLSTPSLPCSDFMKAELDLSRLNSVFRWLWIAGRPMPPRPLHHQLLLNREICVAEQTDLHLLWTSGRMFLKPIPRYLLEPRFWDAYLPCCPEGGPCCVPDKHDRDHELKRDKPLPGTPQQACVHRGLRRCALGLLFSYAALVSHESDFFIAQDKHLIPEEVRWQDWKLFTEDILKPQNIYQEVDKRFIFGELRLSRINIIYSLTQAQFLRTYMPKWNQYGSFLKDNFAWLASGVVYVGLVLTAMQVGLATHTLAQNNAFQSASYGFTVFSILGPIVVAVLIFLVFACVFIINWVETIAYRNKRLGLVSM